MTRATYAVEQIVCHTEPDLHICARALIRQNNCHTPALVPDRTGNLLRRLILRSCIDGDIQCVPGGRADLLHDALITVVEHLIRAETLDEVKVLRRCCSDDAEAAEFGKLDRVLPDGRRTTPDEDGALGSRPRVEWRGQFERLV